MNKKYTYNNLSYDFGLDISHDFFYFVLKRHIVI